jgi:Do/DeqQ family serine protease
MLRRLRFSFLILTAVGISLAACLSAVAAESNSLWSDGRTDGSRASEPLNFGTFRTLAAQASPAVFSVNVSTPGPRRPFGMGPQVDGQGTGFFINADGYAITNFHVIENATTIEVVTDDNKTFPARVIGSDERTDLALLKVDAPTKLPFVRLADSDQVRPGDWVLAIGNPLGLSQSVTAGIVSATGRRDVHPDGRELYEDFIQTDASINPGNSGGPLLDIYGNVIGVNSAVARANTIGFAIPINVAKTLLPQLRSGSVERSWLGVRVQDMTDELAKSMQRDDARGALIADVVPGGPAADAGIEPGDLVLKIEGEEIKDSAELRWLASTAGVGADRSVEIWRDGKLIKKKVHFGRLPGAAAQAGPEPREAQSAGAVTGAGLTVAPLTAELRERFAVPDGLSGVLVVAIDAASGAARGGIQVGDLIRQVGRTEVSTPADFESATAGAARGSLVRLRLQRGEATVFVAYTL